MQPDLNPGSFYFEFQFQKRRCPHTAVFPRAQARPSVPAFAGSMHLLIVTPLWNMRLGNGYFPLIVLLAGMISPF